MVSDFLLILLFDFAFRFLLSGLGAGAWNRGRLPAGQRRRRRSRVRPRPAATTAAAPHAGGGRGGRGGGTREEEEGGGGGFCPEPSSQGERPARGLSTTPVPPRLSAARRRPRTPSFFSGRRWPPQLGLCNSERLRSPLRGAASRSHCRLCTPNGYHSVSITGNTRFHNWQHPFP